MIKKIYNGLFKLFGIMILVFIIAFIVGGFILNDNNIIWRVFSIVMPIAAVSLWLGVILWVIDRVSSNN
ncbi:MAG: hypothetical protein E7257_07335 [Lachnospiraceae bacterium]|nr:hypothetical protein [Lachnospiraceae bacterium]MBQ9934831.1 hypothetical protein [Lachnospiraceae bacterium]